MKRVNVQDLPGTCHLCNAKQHSHRCALLLVKTAEKDVYRRRRLNTNCIDRQQQQ
jgi:hypothetical protein